MPSTYRLPPLPERPCLGLIAPAGPPAPERLARLPAVLDTLGLDARLLPGCQGPAHLDHLAADDARRLADLHEAFADPTLDAVLALRGGYGCARLLPGVDRGLMARGRKPLIGYSDLTALHALRDGLGLAGWHAPMPVSDWLRDEAGLDDARHLLRRLRQGLRAGETLAPRQDPGAQALSRPGVARGRLVGGNLAVLVSLLGTPYMPDLRGTLLFLEDVAEEPYKVDRLLTQLRLAGALDGVAGFLIGSFSDAASPDAVLADRLHPLGRPLLAGWPSGHCCPHEPLPLGLALEMDVAGRCLRVL
ncbi:LD-carboxypeptidase [Pelomonas sp. CA6]|uniref:S66 peptidase family protein n=1 Tax=Pelomonas sp. CA6 TaxID=2907999 RepID=UPI001F4A19B8|nr:LD-carboxypeptidase [Pelomonas sp. CA6]MCH7342616.1 LD-carboxypeptidase [Pelomonas sp. CA6]